MSPDTRRANRWRRTPPPSRMGWPHSASSTPASDPPPQAESGLPFPPPRIQALPVPPTDSSDPTVPWKILLREVQMATNADSPNAPLRWIRLWPIFLGLAILGWYVWFSQFSWNALL